MSEYTPSLEQVRNQWAMNWVNAGTPAMSRKESEAEFDRCISSVKAVAWDEGRDCTGPYPVNPYRGADDE
jgi:hypothetical protein